MSFDLKKCIKCGIEKEFTSFSKEFHKNRNKYYYRNTCIECRILRQKDYKKQYYLKNKEKVLQKNKIWKKNNKEKNTASNKKYNAKNKEKSIKYRKEHYLKNKKRINKRNSEYKKKNKEKSNKHIREKRKNDLKFRITENIRTLLKNSIKYKRNTNHSCLTFLGYSIMELKEHLESKFEPWMSWQNWGRYIPETWNDEDQTTWTWHIDHIVPRYKFDYTSMKDEAFKQCWALSNLRPYSAKQNILDGAQRTR